MVIIDFSLENKLKFDFFTQAVDLVSGAHFNIGRSSQYSLVMKEQNVSRDQFFKTFLLSNRWLPKYIAL